MPLTYAIPDLHGRADLLAAAFARIFADAGNRPGTIVVLGDYVDKGPHSRQVIDRLLEGVPDGWSLICLKGNHDALMLAAVENPQKVADWLPKGGDATLKSYAVGSRRPTPADIPPDHVAWLKRLRLTHADDHRIFVHAGLDARYGLGKQQEKTLLWKRYKPGEGANGYRGRHIVHGHDSSAGNPLTLPGRTNLDALAWRTGRLVVGVYDDAQPGGAIAYLEVLDRQPNGRVIDDTTSTPADISEIDVRPLAPSLAGRLGRFFGRIFGS